MAAKSSHCLTVTVHRLPTDLYLPAPWLTRSSNYNSQANLWRLQVAIRRDAAAAVFCQIAFHLRPRLVGPCPGWRLDHKKPPSRGKPAKIFGLLTTLTVTPQTIDFQTIRVQEIMQDDQRESGSVTVQLEIYSISPLDSSGPTSPTFLLQHPGASHAPWTVSF